MLENNIPFSALGHVTKGEMRIDDESYGYIKDAEKVYDTSIEKHLE